jgi:hypothetical protein
MFRIDWSNPKATVSQVEELVSANLVGIYDGIIVEDGFMYVVTTEPMSSEQEDLIKGIIYSLNDQPTQVAVKSQPSVNVGSSPAFTAKTVFAPDGSIKKLFARNTGFQSPVSVGTNTITYTATIPWAKITGVEVINCEALDTVNFKVMDSTTGSYSTIPNYMLNQFGFTVNLPKDFYQRVSQFDADLYIGMVLRIEYTSVSAKTVGFNLIMNEVK